MGIPYQSETIGVATAINPAVGGIVATATSLIKAKTSHIDWNSANSYAQNATNVLKPYIRSLLSDAQIKQAFSAICRNFREQRNRYWLTTKNADIDRSITEYEQRSKDDVQGALHGIVWLLLIWINQSIPADGTGYADHSKTLFNIIFLKAFEENGFSSQSSTMQNSIQFSPLWKVTIAPASAVTAGGGTNLASVFGGDGNKLLIGIVLAGFVIGMIAMKGGKT